MPGEQETTEVEETPEAATAGEDPLVTKTGKVLTDEEIQALADEAEEGYEVEAVAEPLPDAVPGLELEIRKQREMAVPPAGALPSASEFEAAMAVARVVAATKFVPDSYQGNPDAVVAAIFTGRELGIGPMQSLRDIHMIDGRPVFSASLMMSQMRRGGVSVLESESTRERAYIRAQRADTGEIATVEWTMEEASQISSKGKNLVDKDNWKNYPADMLWARAVGRLARRLGSDLLAGMVYSSEELADLEGFDTDGYNATAAPRIEWDTMDPGQVLHPNAPNGWQDILLVFEFVDAGRDWQKIIGALLQAKYGVERVNGLAPSLRQQVGRRMANLAAHLTDVVMEGKEFPPPNDAELVDSIQWAFEGFTFEPPFPEKAAELLEGEVVEEGGSDAALSPEQQEEMQAALETEAEDLPEFGPEGGGDE
jgi:hypothetical protein